METAAGIYARAEAFKRENGFEGTPILPEHVHVTLFHLGDWAALPDEIVRLAHDAAAQVKVASFDVAFTRAESFRNSTGVYPFVLSGDTAPWRTLHESLGAMLKKVGLGGATQGEFKPHVTLVYDKVRVKPQLVEPVTWTVSDFVLIHSALGKTAHRHLGRWPLGV